MSARHTLSPPPAAGQPPRSKFVGITELAEMLGVSKQRAGQIVEQPGFPKQEDDPPIAQGRIWRRARVERWAKKVGRKPYAGKVNR
jgi:hypothetical protein